MKRLLIVCLFAACGTDAKVKQDAGVTADGAPPDASCFTNPQTHYEIINACTNAVKITKKSNLTKLLPDGGLPPLN